uniref:NADH:ubiquinone reductase (H(+)-translocating) n=1 Tax=Crenidorsum turpiniae TaxID=2774091 RepID=A0A7L7SEZ1_9HEMI|nr:NADH dehydrogenase subunit 5 [Crenidorsum turpiniae]QNV48536.1 NADH dehydrogenase subunit 5 [Crenidorsum turpiniae]
MNLNLMLKTMILTAAATLALSTNMMKKEEAMMVEWKIMEMECNSMTFNMMADWKSMFFIFTVTLISSAIISYSKFYMPSISKTKFIKIILTFVASMIMLILSPSTISMLMGWEGLGMSSFILIMFFMNKKSLMSSLYTMIMNRLGDIMLMISIMLMMDFNSWMITCLSMYSNKTMMTILCLSLFSKSAQIPFSSWLTEAMAAPTPVSALVHSSTLVTAGVYMMIRMETMIKFSHTNTMIMAVATMTLMMASMNATLEWDIKKIVALSTLTQLSTMFVSLAINMYKMALFHMLMHAMFKALIFICSSSMISIANTQDIRKMSTDNQTSLITTTSFIVANLTLCGFIFMSAFYSKELIIEMMMINKINYTMLLIFYACMGITMVYSMKTIVFIFFLKNKKKMKMMKETLDQKKSKMIILPPTIVLGNKMNWMINLNTQIPHMTSMEKMMPLTMMLIIIVTIKESFLNKKLIKNSKMKMMMNYMWFMKNFSIMIKIMILNSMMKTSKITETGNLIKMTKVTNSKINSMVKMNFKFNQKSFKKMMLTMMIMLITAA